MGWRRGRGRAADDEAGRGTAFPLARVLGVLAPGAATGAVEGVRARVGWHSHGVDVVGQASRFVGSVVADGVGDVEVVAPL